MKSSELFHSKALPICDEYMSAFAIVLDCRLRDHSYKDESVLDNSPFTPCRPIVQC